MAVFNDQQGFRIRTDATKAEGGIPVWPAAQNVNPRVALNTPFRIRIGVANIGTTATGTATWVIYVSRNGGVYAAVPGSASGNAVYMADATAGASTDGSAITTSLLTGMSGTMSSGFYRYTTTTSTMIFNPGTFKEFEWGLAFNGAVVVPGDIYTFRLYRSTTAFEAYTVTPTISFAAVLGSSALMIGI